MEILVIGLGGIGSIYSLLLRLGRPDKLRLTFIARSNFDAIRSGIKITSAKYGAHTLIPDATFRTTAEAAATGVKYDYVFCTTKALPSSPSVPLLMPVVSKDTTIVLIQNGLGIEDPIHAAFPENTLISCIAYIGVWQASPGNVTHSKLEKLVLAVFPDQDSSNPSSERLDKDTRAVKEIESIMRAGGGDASVVPSAPAARWEKLVWNASFNTVCTITGMDTNAVTACPPARELVLAAMNEIVTAANAAGYGLPRSLVQENWDRTSQMAVAYKPSMLLDYEAGREMEVDVILDAPVQEAGRVGVEVPTLKVIKTTLDILNWKIRNTRPA